jgi:sec-independent protein translocase protein TatB
VFNVGPFEMLVLAAVALIVFGPDKLPQLAKDAARMLRTLRDLAQGARSQLNNELGPEFADFDLRSLNPRTAIRNALLGDEDLSALNPRETIARAIRGEDDPAPQRADAGPAVESPATAAGSPATAAGSPATAAGSPATEPAIRQTTSPLAPGDFTPGDFTPYDPDAT